MKALAAIPAALLLTLAAKTPAVAAPADDPEQIVEDCSDSDLPPEVVNYCLRRIHRLNETDPTADNEALEAQLQRRADGLNRNDDSSAPPPSDTDRERNSGDDRNDDDQRYGHDLDQDQPDVNDTNRPPQDDEDSSDDDSRDPPPQRPNGD